MLNLRRANRGIEALAMDAAGKLHGVLQSPIAASVTLEDGTTKVATQSTARFVRWVVVDPVAATSRTYAYPLSKADWRSGDTGQAKMGDLTFIGGNKFVGIEQGLNAAGNLVNKLMLNRDSGQRHRHFGVQPGPGSVQRDRPLAAGREFCDRGTAEALCAARFERGGLDG